MAKLTCKLATTADAVELTLVGDLDEHTAGVLAAVALPATPARVRVRLGGLRHINSIGVGQWGKFVQRLKGRWPVELHDCTVAFVHYVNLTSAISVGCRIASFHAAYLCRPCERTQDVLVQADAAQAFAAQPAPVCGACGRAMEHETPVEDFLEFLGKAS